MVGEIRDREVAETAIHAAQTGHLVFSTLHTNSAAGGFPRLIDLGVDPRIIGSAINAILGQRLVRVLCPECKEAYVATAAELDRIRTALTYYPDPVTIAPDTTLYRGVGCSACGNTGFKGRVGVFEAIIVDEAVEEVVIRDPREHMILEAAKAQRIPSMAEDGMMKVLAGVTTVTELERVVDLTHAKRASTDTLSPYNLDGPEDNVDFYKHIV
jgi:general secretion pathway protein E